MSCLRSHQRTVGPHQEPVWTRRTSAQLPRKVCDEARTLHFPREDTSQTVGARPVKHIQQRPNSFVIQP